MRRAAKQVRFSALAILLACPLLSGCFAGGYAYPTLQFIPRTYVGAAVANEVHAFRVDIVDYTGSFDLSSSDDYLFREIPLTSQGATPALSSARFGRGWWGCWIAHNYHSRMHPTIRLRLYRPGYETVEVQPWHWPHAIDWKPAATLEAQEHAVDEVISTVGTNDLYKVNPDAWDHNSVDYSMAVPKTEAHREALQFVAGEYTRLGVVAWSQGDAAAAARLYDKARQIESVCATQPNARRPSRPRTAD